MKWGVRRYQNEDGTLTEAGKKRYKKWATKNETKIRNQAYDNVKEEMLNYEKELLSKKGTFDENGMLSKQAIKSYNTKLADLMNKSLTDVKTDNGSAVYFVADTVKLGVNMAMSNDKYIMQQFTNTLTGEKTWFYSDEFYE